MKPLFPPRHRGLRPVMSPPTRLCFYALEFTHPCSILGRALQALRRMCSAVAASSGDSANRVQHTLGEAHGASGCAVLQVGNDLFLRSDHGQPLLEQMKTLVE